MKQAMLIRACLICTIACGAFVHVHADTPLKDFKIIIRTLQAEPEALDINSPSPPIYFTPNLTPSPTEPSTNTPNAPSRGLPPATGVPIEVPPRNNPPPGASNTNNTAAQSPSKSSKSNPIISTRNIIIIAVSVGLGVLIVCGAILCVWCRYNHGLKAPAIAAMDMESGAVQLQKGNGATGAMAAGAGAGAAGMYGGMADTNTRMDTNNPGTGAGAMVKVPAGQMQHRSAASGENASWTVVNDGLAVKEITIGTTAASPDRSDREDKIDRMETVDRMDRMYTTSTMSRGASTAFTESTRSTYSVATASHDPLALRDPQDSTRSNDTLSLRGPQDSLRSNDTLSLREPQDSTRSRESLPQPSMNAPRLPALPPNNVSSGTVVGSHGPLTGLLGGGGGRGHTTAVPATGDAFVAVVGYGILAASVGIAREIIEAGDRVVANHARCRRIITRIQLMQPMLHKLQERLKGPNPPEDIEPMVVHLKGVYEDCRDTVLKWCDKSNSWKSVIRNLVRSKAFEDEFVDLNERLSNCYNDLNVAFTINKVTTEGTSVFALPTPQMREAEAEADLREDLQTIASELLARGWSDLSSEEQGVVKELYLHHGLDLEQLLKQAKKSWREDKVKDLRVPWRQLDMMEEVGSGGFGTVYLARWAGSQVAVKKFSATLVTERVRKDLEREAYIMSQLHHPNVARFFGLVMEHPHYALVMQYYPHGTLLQLLHNDEIELTWPERYHLAADVAQGMRYLHSRPVEAIVHGDLKTTNLLIDDNGRVVITDFGLAKVKTITKTIAPGSTAVSACYCAPELLGSVSVTRTAASDVYSYAMILFEIATREIPFQGLDVHLVYDHIRRGVRPEIPSFVSPPFADLIRWCWHQRPADRPSFDQISERLATLL